ncbi:MAG: acyloxyacyl hydrolase [Candidatus Omnitrophica bacterium]|nr:acyloxyacyl hydrolase [Candidatus Omnitrophota bacterium]MCF7893525.1 acyloxyacyl hydrolase [Candidatus Omnitrophota bacterium]
MSIFESFALDSVDVLSGYLEANLEEKDEYRAIPLLVGLNFNGNSFFERVGLDLPGRVDFILEPFVNTVVNPDKNIEVGSNFLIKYTLTLTKKVQPFVKAGAGVVYMSQHTKEQSTQYNFLPQAGGGIQYFFSDRVALNLEYRYRHLSNAGAKHPNSGIDSDLILCGLSFYFK